MMEVDGSRITQLVRATTTQSKLSDPSWSPDGKSVLFTRRVDGHESVFTIDADGGPERKVVEGCCAAWQPVTPQSESSS